MANNRRDHNWQLTRLDLAYGASTTAEWAAWIALLVHAHEVGGSTAAGVTAICLMLPAALAAPLARRSSGGERPRRVLLGAFVLTTAGLGGAATTASAHGPLAVTVSSAALAMASATFVRPAGSAVYPGVVRSAAELAVANAHMSLADNLSVLLGPLLAAALIAGSGPWLALAVCAALNLLGVLTTTRLAVVERSAATGQARSSARQRAALRGRPHVEALLAVSAAHYVLVGALGLVYLQLAIDELGLQATAPALLAAAFGAGTVACTLAARHLVAGPSLGTLVLGGLAVSAGTTAAIGAAGTLWAALAFLPLLGFGRAALAIGSRMLLQRATPPEALESLLTTLEMVRRAGMVAGALLAFALGELADVRVTLLVLGALLAAVLVGTGDHVRRADFHTDAPSAAVALLRHIPAFAALPPGVLDAVARSGSELHVEAGSTVIREGDIGDRYFVLVAGLLEVERGGEFIRTVVPGDGIGEIALLADIHRTASVTAATPAELLVIDRAPFLTAVTGHDVSHLAAWTTMQTRLLEFDLVQHHFS